MTLGDFWEATPWQVIEVVKASRDREVGRARQALIDAHNTAAFAASAFWGKLPKLDSMLGRFDDAVKPGAATAGPVVAKAQAKAQTPEAQAALLRMFVSKPQPQVTAGG